MEEFNGHTLGGHNLSLSYHYIHNTLIKGVMLQNNAFPLTVSVKLFYTDCAYPLNLSSNSISLVIILELGLTKPKS